MKRLLCPAQTAASCLHLVFVCRLRSLSLCLSLACSRSAFSGVVGRCWSLVNEYLGPLPRGEPDSLAGFYGLFSELQPPAGHTAAMSCHVCPSVWEGGGGWRKRRRDSWLRAKKVLLRPQTYVATVQQGKGENWICCFFRSPLVLESLAAFCHKLKQQQQPQQNQQP